LRCERSEPRNPGSEGRALHGAYRDDADPRSDFRWLRCERSEPRNPGSEGRALHGVYRDDADPRSDFRWLRRARSDIRWLRCERSEPRNPATGGRAATEKRLSTDPLNHADSGVGLSVLDA
jgi:hypothetical protein